MVPAPQSFVVVAVSIIAMSIVVQLVDAKPIVVMSFPLAARSFRGAVAQHGCSSSGATDRERAVGRRPAGGLHVVFSSNFMFSQGSDIATSSLFIPLTRVVDLRASWALSDAERFAFEHL